ncbi:MULTISPECIES: hypothetical protein [unclassified Streptomyces]|uniref:hypothetical protein n=1 Tax=unclassified Streptomyces TaxID=2593676 RepID=UPI002285F67C|nr:hypothetical protein [Streptomyces sp. Je 1-369]WAL97109.1 hypothetical protein NOO62_22995 [Streptomyces sp. Je 1-369]
MRITALSAKRLGHALVGVALTGGLLAVAAPARAAAGDPVAVSSYAYTSAAGDYIGQGESGTYKDPQSPLRISGTAESLTVRLPDAGWSIDIAAPRGEKLRPGVYRGAERAAFRTGRSPGLDVSGGSRGCNEVYGQFAVNQIETDADGNVTVLDASFTQNCESATAPALKGAVKYRAYPLSYRFQSDPDDYIGGGRTVSYTGSTSTFGAYGDASRVHYTASGKRDGWSADLGAPKGQTLEVGKTYQANRFGDDGLAELDVNGNGRGCNTTSGEFKVTKLALNEAGELKAFAATFKQYCGSGGTAALNGTIHYYA